jgi:hypothetical protein
MTVRSVGNIKDIMERLSPDLKPISGAGLIYQRLQQQPSWALAVLACPLSDLSTMHDKEPRGKQCAKARQGIRSCQDY